MSLDGCEKQVKKLLLQSTKINQRNIGTQTDLISDLPETPDSYHTAGESLRETFGVPCVQSNNEAFAQRQTIVADQDHLSSAGNSLQTFKFGDVDTANDDILETWLHQNMNDHQQGRLSRPML